MTRQQKIILAILAVLDLAVIGAMGAFAVTTTRRAHARRQAQQPGIVAGADPCVATILDVLAEPYDVALVDWSPAYARIEVSRQTPAVDEPPAELIWELIDRLPPGIENQCPAPETVTLAVHTGVPRRQTQTAVVAGAALMDWLRSDLSDEALAAQTHYRIATAATP